ncbi:MAG: 4-hydroxy-3-methylbut-2-en-1-yl diphosphate synthase, partial [Planctomycetota bacterium]|nr:4-hydroxy-3-methylbut-2-en-1-yl diphosphate synthase [Planctomycetota bacterium]
LWCGPKKVNLKRGTETLGAYGYGEILHRVREEFDRQVAERSA